MEIYQNRKRRLGRVWLNIFLFGLFSAIVLFILLVFLRTIIIDFMHSSNISRQDFILLVPAFLFGLSGCFSFYSLRKHWNFLKIKGPILTITAMGIEVYHEFQDKIIKPWDEIGEIEYRVHKWYYGPIRGFLLVKDTEDTPLANIPVNMLDINVENMVEELRKYTEVKNSK